MNAPELEKKFETLCSYAFDKARIEELKHAIQKLECLDDISRLIRLLIRD
jgi:hypothetical protein